MTQAGILTASSIEEIVSETFGLSTIGRSLAITHRRGVVGSFRLVCFYCRLCLSWVQICKCVGGNGVGKGKTDIMFWNQKLGPLYVDSVSLFFYN